MRNSGGAEKKRRKLTQRVQFKFVLAFFTLIVALLGLVDTYPIAASRDLVASEKESSLLSQAGVISASLSALDSLSSDAVGQVMSLLDIAGLERIIVTDGTARIVYDSRSPSDGGKYALLSEVALALDGRQVFWSRFADGAFTSRAAIPVYSSRGLSGAVYICERDESQAELIISVQSRLWMISLVCLAAAMALTVVFSRALTARITRLAEAMRVVRGGDYAHRIKPEGNDELTELSEEFNDLTERLQTTEAERRRFVSDASHELKTPLAAIRLLTDSILQNENIDNATAREFVSDIGQEAERLSRITEDLLRLTRLDSGVVEAPSRIRVGPVLERVVRMLRPVADGKEIDVRTIGDAFVVATEGELHQILYNLAENAIKYNRQGGFVGIRVTEGEETTVITVEDNGIGIPAKDLTHVFERFYRVDKARSRAAGGTGLGLSIVRDTVSRRGGDIWAENIPEGGTRFIVKLPCLEREEAGE